MQASSVSPVFDRQDAKAHFTFFHRDNPKRMTMRQLAQVKDDKPVDYRRVSSRFFVVSGVRQGIVFYRRCNRERNISSLACFDIAYPKTELRDWDAIVTRISLSLKTR